MPTEADVAGVLCFYAVLAAASEGFWEEAVWHLPGRSRISGTHRGWPAIRDDFLAKLRALGGGTFRAQVLDLAVGTEYIVVVGKGLATARRPPTGRHGRQLVRVQDGKIVEVRGHYSDQTALDAFFGA